MSGKKGVARLRFAIVERGGERIGEGEKNLVLSGLRPFDETAMRGVIEDYEGRRQAFVASDGRAATNGRAGTGATDPRSAADAL